MHRLMDYKNILPELKCQIKTFLRLKLFYFFSCSKIKHKTTVEFEEMVARSQQNA